MKILVINAGSSSLKYQLFDMETHGTTSFDTVKYPRRGAGDGACVF